MTFEQKVFSAGNAGQNICQKLNKSGKASQEQACVISALRNIWSLQVSRVTSGW